MKRITLLALTIVLGMVSAIAQKSKPEVGELLKVGSVTFGTITKIEMSAQKNSTGKLLPVAIIEFESEKVYNQPILKKASKKLGKKYPYSVKIVQAGQYEEENISLVMTSGEHLIAAAKHSRQGKIILLSGTGVGVIIAFVGAPYIGAGVALVAYIISTVKQFKHDNELEQAGIKMD